ncbi:hypothetical protein B0H67DRAFT_129523 [Lasiosphaeris hirsuta]|uniref:Uncharacterized protein n=1 Tax=Lasiosphaeris hirsuta TaxID=260670 RepID=A0AA40E362_9PEZI|nr:hypothetical protein B0H67DRAFT_129523 [Lasiosphaeris hirsuta]
MAVAHSANGIGGNWLAWVPDLGLDDWGGGELTAEKRAPFFASHIPADDTYWIFSWAGGFFMLHHRCDDLAREKRILHSRVNEHLGRYSNGAGWSVFFGVTCAATGLTFWIVFRIFGEARWLGSCNYTKWMIFVLQSYCRFVYYTLSVACVCAVRYSDAI